MGNDPKRTPVLNVAPEDWFTHIGDIQFHHLDEGADPLFLSGSRCKAHIRNTGDVTGSSFLAPLDGVGIDVSGEVENEALVAAFKVHMVRTLDEQKNRASRRLKGPLTHHIVVRDEPQQTWIYDKEKGEPIQGLHTEVGMFSVQRGVYIRKYGDTVEIPMPVRLGPDGSGVLTDEDVDCLLSNKALTEDIIQAVVGKTPTQEEVDKSRKEMTNEILGFVVDLLKAGSGKYEGEASQTLRNLVSERLGEIVIDATQDVRSSQEIFLSKALVRVVGLGKFVLPAPKHEYFSQRVLERIGHMKVKRGCQVRNGPTMPVRIIRDGDGIVRMDATDLLVKERTQPKANLHDEAQKARLRKIGDAAGILSKGNSGVTTVTMDKDGSINHEVQAVLDTPDMLEPPKADIELGESLWDQDPTRGPSTGEFPEDVIKTDRPDA